MSVLFSSQQSLAGLFSNILAERSRGYNLMLMLQYCHLLCNSSEEGWRAKVVLILSFVITYF